MFELTRFDLTLATLAAGKLRQLGTGCTNLEQASQRAVRFFYDEFVGSMPGKSAFVLARCYKTHPLGELPPDLASFARSVFPEMSLETRTQCLTLLASQGDDPAWCDRHHSNRHRAIPLANEEILGRLPMVSRLTSALGLDASEVVRPASELLLEKERRGFNVFHVEQAAGSPYIPAQDFVKQWGVGSVIGFGFVLPPAQVFTTILFCRDVVHKQRAELFKTVALSLKVGMVRLAVEQVFEGASS